MTTALEAYLTGMIFASLADTRAGVLPKDLRMRPVFDDQGQINGILQVEDVTNGEVIATITTTQVRPR